MQLAVKITLLIFLSALTTSAQNRNYPLNFELQNDQDRTILSSGKLVHNSLKPLNARFTNGVVDQVYSDSLKVYTTFHQKLHKAHFFDIKGEDFRIMIDPLFNIEIGMDFSDTSGRGTLQDKGGTFYVNTRGFRVMADIGKHVSVSTRFYENQAFFPDYIRSFNTVRREFLWDGSKYAAIGQALVPGQGRAKRFKTTGFDYAMATGYVSYSPLENLNLQFGHGKHFIGQGYRSLLLSDNSFNYPYWSLRSTFLDGKLSYNFIYAYLLNFYRFPEHTTPEANYIAKNGSFTHISFKPAASTEIAFFEGTIWQRYDESTGSISAPVLSYIPVPGLSSIANGWQDSSHNVIIGLTVQQNLGASGMIYGQVMLDDPTNNKYGFQIGGKWFNPFNAKGLSVTAEFNRANDFSYSHYNRWQGFSHYGQELAHPYGAGFSELVLYARYLHHSRFWGSYKYNFADRTGAYNIANNGSSVLLDYEDGSETNGDRAILNFHEIRVGYKCNVKTHMNLFMGVNIRTFSDNQKHFSTYVHVGIKTGLTNRYYDF